MQSLILPKKEQSKFLHNLQIFIAPVAIVYLTFVSAEIVDGVSLNDFIPNQVTIGSAVGYLLATAIDYFRKLNK
jgi:hypothetical protein